MSVDSDLPRPPSPLYVVRHGETEWNVERRMQGGEGDSPLTARGRRQAAAMGTLLRAVGADALPAYCSPQGRAVETARIALGEGLARLDPRLSEVAMGPFSGRLIGELRSEHPDLFGEDMSLTWYFRIPGGERLETMQARLAAFLRDLPGPAVIVCHGMTSRILRGVALGLCLDATLALPGGQGIIHVVEDGRHRTLG
jgi:probable phosphoglycerate mutase